MTKTMRNALRTKWESFKGKLGVLSRDKSDKVHNPMQALTKAFEGSCLLLRIPNITSNQWWHRETKSYDDH